LTAGPPRHPHEEQRARIRNLIEILHTAKCTKRARQIDLRIQATHCSSIYTTFSWSNCWKWKRSSKVFQRPRLAYPQQLTVKVMHQDQATYAIHTVYDKFTELHMQSTLGGVAAGKRSRLGVKSCLKFEWIFFFFKFQTAFL